ncbi:hypothetical protein DAKH74_040980 [Maudiozyma humilis]|uniref:Uncharacterized protein n=1 Tax=Maudiozyma humilis TaxID=51915 RepID=A0AAV5S1K6_MAUHU|nr:hypothetical protein DAKH74_040980 [Kazachstania humilis]
MARSRRQKTPAGMLPRQLMHIVRRNVRFIGVTLVLLVVLTHLSFRSGRTATNSPELPVFSLDSSPLPDRLQQPAAHNGTLPPVNNTEITIQRTRAQEKILAERIKSGYKKYPKETVQGAMVPSFANEGFRPRACLLMFLSSPTGDRVEPQLIYDTVLNVQRRFNDWFEYDWVFLSADGYEYKHGSLMATLNDLLPSEQYNFNVEFAVASEEHFWHIPDSVDVNKISDSQIRLTQMEFGDSKFFRLMSRYFTGHLAREKFLEDYDWIWRIEPGLELLCDVKYDLFRWMQDRNQAVGFSLSHKEPKKELVDGLFDLSKKFAAAQSQKIIDYSNNMYEFIAEYPDAKDLDKAKNAEERLKKEREAAKGGADPKPNNCQMDAGFLITNLNFMRSLPYWALFQDMEKSGGFFYHRWSASAAQTMAASLLLRRNQIFFFDNVGFRLGSSELSSSSEISSISRNFYNCPIDDETFREFNCECDQGRDFTFMKDSCTSRFYDITNRKKPDDWDKH